MTGAPVSNGPTAPPGGSAEAGAPPDAGTLGAITITVRPGDSFWRIAATALRQAWEREPTDREIDPFWRALIATNRQRLRDPRNPDLLRPGDGVVVPAPPAKPAAPDV